MPDYVVNPPVKFSSRANAENDVGEKNEPGTGDAEFATKYCNANETQLKRRLLKCPANISPTTVETCAT